MPITFREKNVLINKSGDITICYKYHGINFCSKVPDELDHLTREFASSLSYLGEKIVIHKQDIFLHKTMRTDYSNASHYLTESYLKKYDGKEYFDCDSYIYVTKTSSFTVNRTYTSVTRESEVRPGRGKEMKTDLYQDILSFERELLGWTTYLANQQMVLIPLEEKEVDAVIEGWFSLYDYDFIQDIDLSDLNNKRIGNYYYNMVSVGNGEQMPDAISSSRLNPDYKRFSEQVIDAKGNEQVIGLFSDFFCSLGYGLKMNHVYNSIFFVDGKEYSRDMVQKLRKNFGSWRLFSVENGYTADALIEFEQATVANNEFVARCHFNIMYWDNKPLELRNEQVRSVFKEYGILGRIANKYDVRHLFFSCCPGNAGTMPVDETFLGHASALSSIALKETLNIAPLQGKGLLFADRDSGALIRRDCWHLPYERKTIANRNWLGVGKSGSGKSSMTIEIIRQYLEMGFNCTVIDVGRSFEVLVRGHGGNYIIYKDGVELGVNPYEIQGDWMDSVTLEFLSSFTATLWRPNDALRDEERDALDNVLIACYGLVREERSVLEKNKFTGADESVQEVGFRIHGDFSNATVATLYHFVENNSEIIDRVTKNNTKFFDKDSFLLALEKFVNGKYDRLLRGKNLLDTQKSLTVWELDEIKENPVLFPIVSMLIMYLTTNIIWKKTSVDKIVLIEEAWLLLSKPSMAAYIKWLFKTVRKFDGAVGVNIQQAGDLVVPNTNIKETVLANTDIKFIMSHTVPMAKDLAKILDWNNHQLAELLSIPLDEKKTSGKKRFTEFLSVVGTDVKALRLEVSPEQIVNFMSEMKDKEKLFHLVEQANGNWELGIKQYVKQYF